jgi:hypothetical protein
LTASEKQLHRATVVRALQVLGAELAGQGVRGQIFLVGGEAIAFAYSQGRVTDDVAAVFEPTALIHQAAAKVAKELGLSDDWLNAGVTALLSSPDPSAVPLPVIEGIEVSTASPRYLLALKLRAARWGEDDAEIVTLLRQAGIAGLGEAVDLLQQLFAGWKPPLGTRLFLAGQLGPPRGRDRRRDPAGPGPPP